MFPSGAIDPNVLVIEMNSIFWICNGTYCYNKEHLSDREAWENTPLGAIYNGHAWIWVDDCIKIFPGGAASLQDYMPQERLGNRPIIVTNGIMWTLKGTDWTQVKDLNSLKESAFQSTKIGTFWNGTSWTFTTTDWTPKHEILDDMYSLGQIEQDSLVLAVNDSLWVLNGISINRLLPNYRGVDTRKVDTLENNIGVVVKRRVWIWNGTDWSEGSSGIPDLEDLISRSPYFTGLFWKDCFWLWTILPGTKATTVTC